MKFAIANNMTAPDALLDETEALVKFDHGRVEREDLAVKLL